VLNLVTQHEDVYRRQDVQMAEFERRLAMMEQNQAQGSDFMAALRERDVLLELTRMQAGMDRLSSQLDSLSSSVEALTSMPDHISNLSRPPAPHPSHALAFSWLAWRRGTWGGGTACPLPLRSTP
jgi:hypothetical protein